MTVTPHAAGAADTEVSSRSASGKLDKRLAGNN